MAWRYVSTDISRLPQDLLSMERSLPTGGVCLIQFGTRFVPLEREVEEFYNDMVNAGFHVTRPQVDIIEGIPITSFLARKGSPLLLALIPMIPTAIIGGLVAYGIYKINDISVSITNLLVPVLLIVFGGVIVIGAILRKPAESVATAYIEAAGRQKLLAATSPLPGKKVEALAAGRDDYSGRNYKAGDRVVFVNQSIFQKALPPFLNNTYVLPGSYKEMSQKYGLKQLYLPSVESLPDTVSKIEIPFQDAPDWVKQAWQARHPGRPRIEVYRTEVATIHSPWYDYLVRDIVAHKGNQTMARYVPSYESLLSSTPEEKALYFGGAVKLALDEGIAVMDYSSNYAKIELYVHPSAYEPPKMVAPSLTERQLQLLAAFRGYTSSYRKEVLERNKVTPAEIVELQNLGLLDKRPSITITGRNVVGNHESFPSRWANFGAETEPLYLPDTMRYDPYKFAKEVLESNSFTQEDIKLYSGKSGTNPQGVSDDVWSRAFQDLGGKFNRIGSMYLVGGALPLPEEYLAGLFDNLAAYDIENAALELHQNPELQEEGELPDPQRLASLKGKTQKVGYLVRWITAHPNSIASHALVDNLEKKLNARMEQTGLRPEDLLPETIPPGFKVRRINIHQVKVSRTDRKGEFIVDFGYWGSLPEGPKQWGPDSIVDVLTTRLGLKPAEVNLILARQEALIFDDDPQAKRLWDWWNGLQTGDFNPSTMPVKYVVITEQGDTKLYKHSVVPKEQVLKANEKMKQSGLRPAQYSEAPEGASTEEFGGHWKPPTFIPKTEGTEGEGYERVEMFCQKCGKQVPSPSSFRTPEALREYMITGKCQDCQDKEKLALKQVPGFEIIEKVKNLWNKACDFDKIPVGSKFVTFSDENPFVKEYNEAVGQLLRFKQLKSGRYQPQTSEPGKQTPNPFPDVTVFSELLQSIGEEEKAAATYRKRGKSAATGGDRKTGELYEHIALEEDEHAKEFGDRAIGQVVTGGLDYLSDSPEFLSQTIEDSGWKQKLESAFLSRIEMLRGKKE